MYRDQFGEFCLWILGLKGRIGKSTINYTVALPSFSGMPFLYICNGMSQVMTNFIFNLGLFN